MVENNEKTVKGFKLRGNLVGKGIVNYDSNDQKWLSKECYIESYKKYEFQCNKLLDKEISKEIAKDQFQDFIKVFNNKNIKFAKKDFETYKDENGNEHLKQYPKISSACIRYNLFGKPLSAEMTKFPSLACKYLVSPLGFIRGYMRLDKEDKENNFSKRSSLRISDAVDKNAVCFIEQHSRSGKRDDTSLYYIEQTGDTNYKFDANFDIRRAQFVCYDNIDEDKDVAFAKRYVEGTKDGMSYIDRAFMDRYGRLPYEEDYFIGTEEPFCNETSRYGYKMDNKFINDIFKDLLKHLVNFEIVNGCNNFVKMQNLEIMPIYDGTEDSEWIPITKENVNDLDDFNIKEFFVKGEQYVNDVDDKKSKKEKK